MRPRHSSASIRMNSSHQRTPEAQNQGPRILPSALTTAPHVTTYPHETTPPPLTTPPPVTTPSPLTTPPPVTTPSPLTTPPAVTTPPPLTTPPAVTTPPRKSSIRLQERRGSNLALLLDVSGLEAGPLCAVSTPKEVWLQLLHTSTRRLSHVELQEAARDTLVLQQEYQKIPTNFVNTSELNVPGHMIKDRYKTILPNPETRVVLKSPEEEQSPDRYINANYIRGYQGAPKAYIATQGPMVHTVGDFWDMVWQEKAPAIVMLTRLKEEQQKCELYWPQSDTEPGTFGRFRLSVTNRSKKHGFTISDISVQLNSESRKVRHFWFSSWPDHHIPECTSALLKLVQEVEAFCSSPTAGEEQNAGGPVVVHCSAGIGRSGCFIASSVCCKQLRHSGSVDVLEAVCQLRLDRGGMIQTPEQYQFLYCTLAQHSLQLQGEEVENPDLTLELQTLHLKDQDKTDRMLK